MKRKNSINENQFFSKINLKRDFNHLFVDFFWGSQNQLELINIKLNFCLFMIISKIVVSAYLALDKCQYLRIGCMDFGFKSSFRNVIKFYGELSKTWIRSDHEIFIKKALKLTDPEKNKFSKILRGEEASRISKTIVWES